MQLIKSNEGIITKSVTSVLIFQGSQFRNELKLHGKENALNKETAMLLTKWRRKVLKIISLVTIIFLDMWEHSKDENQSRDKKHEEVSCYREDTVENTSKTREQGLAH